LKDGHFTLFGLSALVRFPAAGDTKRDLGSVEAHRFHAPSSRFVSQAEALPAASLVSPACPGEALAIMPDIGSRIGCKKGYWCGKAVQLAAAESKPQAHCKPTTVK